MARWMVRFEDEVEAESEEEALLAAEDRMFSYGQTESLDPLCDYCQNRSASKPSPYWLDGDVCNRCYDDLEEENAEDSE